ncbi:MAG TPA: hypothetical protein VKA51_01035 [Rubrobacteraceae bacterium]|nr:hypothetical protein [Rubrobacteraceae bacterium]
MTNTKQTTVATAGDNTDVEESAKGTWTTELTLRAGRSEDAETCGSICDGAFKAIADQHNFPPDFPSSEVASGLVASILSRGDVYSVVAEVDGRVVGSFACSHAPPV